MDNIGKALDIILEEFHNTKAEEEALEDLHEALNDHVNDVLRLAERVRHEIIHNEPKD